ncbi:uncharacterized protein [Centruroides vittatus]|uniref:uncharacterized protein n=1 Tax=Centruroides vittatus TaxID=120091 RepID=UPI00350F4EB2
MGCVITKKNRNNRLKDVLPEVNIQIGNRVKPNSFPYKIVFVFGGPGSRKGRIVNDLVQGYGFHVINAENIIRLKLMEKINSESEESESNKYTGSAKDFEQLLRKRPKILTLQWVLEKISEELQQATEEGCKYYLIDLVPNLRAILQVSTFIKDCNKEMEQFEKEWPCMFALNLAQSEETMVENISTAVAKNPNHMQKGGQSDEKDFTKTKKRYEEYSSSVKEFLKYFEESERLATVNVSCGVADLIWSRISEFFFSMGFKTKMAINTVILFIFKGDDISSIDLEKYRMELIHANTLMNISNASLEDLFLALNEHIKNSRVSIESFVVDLKDYSVFEKLQEKDDKQIFFVDGGENHLHQYIYVGSQTSNCKKNLFEVSFKAVSTTENEICLFPKEIPTEVCKQLAVLYADTKEVVYNGELSNNNRSL